MPDFSKLEFIQREAFAFSSQLVKLQENINTGASGAVKLAYISGSVPVAVGSSFNAANVSETNLTSSTIAWLGFDTNDRPFIYKSGGGGYSGGMVEITATLSAACSSSDSAGATDTDSAGDSATVTTRDSVYAVAAKYTYYIAVNCTDPTAPVIAQAVANSAIGVGVNGGSLFSHNLQQIGTGNQSDSGTDDIECLDYVSPITVTKINCTANTDAYSGLGLFGGFGTASSNASLSVSKVNLLWLKS